MIDREKGYRFSGAWPEEETPPTVPHDDVARTVAFGSPPSATSGPKPSRKSPHHSPSGWKKTPGGPRASGAAPRRRPFTPADASELGPLIDAADAAIEGIRDKASRDIRSFEAITRLTRLVDVGRTLASTLELITAKPLHRQSRPGVTRGRKAPISGWSMRRGKSSRSWRRGPAAEAVFGWVLPLGEGTGGAGGQPREKASCSTTRKRLRRWAIGLT